VSHHLLCNTSFCLVVVVIVVVKGRGICYGDRQRKTKQNFAQLRQAESTSKFTVLPSLRSLMLQQPIFMSSTNNSCRPPKAFAYSACLTPHLLSLYVAALPTLLRCFFLNAFECPYGHGKSIWNEPSGSGLMESTLSLVMQVLLLYDYWSRALQGLKMCKSAI
jgi:hypothetical protein